MTITEGQNEHLFSVTVNGGLNATLSADITPGQPLRPKVPYDVEFRLGVMQNGSFRFLVNVEALPPALPAAGANAGARRGAVRKQATSDAKGKP